MDQWLRERPALSVLRAFGEAEPGDGILAHTGAEVMAAARGGFLPERVFLLAPFGADALSCADRCRLIAGRMEDLLLLDRLAESAGLRSLLKVGLRLSSSGLPPVENAFSPASLAGYAREIRQLRRLTVRGCFFCGSLAGVHGDGLGRFFREGYEAAKRMTVSLPCAMPCLCYEGAIRAVTENAERHPETAPACLQALDTVTMQNETAFYAKLFLT